VTTDKLIQAATKASLPAIALADEVNRFIDQHPIRRSWKRYVHKVLTQAFSLHNDYMKEGQEPADQSLHVRRLIVRRLKLAERKDVKRLLLKAICLKARITGKPTPFICRASYQRGDSRNIP